MGGCTCFLSDQDPRDNPPKTSLLVVSPGAHSLVEVKETRLSAHGALLGIHTFCFGTDEAGGGAVEEVQDPSHSYADVRVAGVKVQGGESLKLEPDKLLWGHFEMRDLTEGAKKGQQGGFRVSDRGKAGRVAQAMAEHASFCLTPLTHTKGKEACRTWAPSLGEWGVVTPLERPRTSHCLARDLCKYFVV